VLYFINELYNYQFDINHHCKIIVDNLHVSIEAYTHGFEGVTELDLKIKKTADELESDLKYFKRNK
jgi:pterin-4a-carbinolamine dehydratase